MVKGAPRGTNLDRRRRRVLLLWAGALYSVAVAMAPLVWHKRGAGPANPVDRWGRNVIGPDLTRVLRDVHVGPTASGLFPHLAALGSPRDVVALALLLALLSLAARDLLGLAMCAFGPLCAILLTEAGAKPLVHRVRASAYQYPSGHCTGAAAVGTLGILLLYRRGGWRAVRRWGWIFIVPPILVFFSVQRVMLHDVTESIAGLAVGTATMLVCTVALTTLAEHRHRQNDLRANATRC
jgi:membrane-associated phospholipid phosphatase